MDESRQAKCHGDHARTRHEGRNFNGGRGVAGGRQGQDSRLVGVQSSHKLVVDARRCVAGNVFHFDNDKPCVKSQGSRHCVIQLELTLLAPEDNLTLGLVQIREGYS